jgi:hypothetical protein
MIRSLDAAPVSGGEHQGQRLRGLDAPRDCPRSHAGFGEATFAEIWLSARRKDATVQNVLQQAEALSLEWAA